MTSLALAPRISQAFMKVDRVVLASLVLLGVHALVSPDQAAASAAFTARSLLSILPYMALAVGLGAWARASGADEQIARAFAAHEAIAIMGAAAIGAVAPFCGVGVIPLVAAALIGGVPLSAVMAFWLASPLMNPATYLLSISEFGLGFANARLLSAVVLGLFAGYGTAALTARGVFADALRPDIAGRSNRCGVRAASVAAPVVWRFWQDPLRRAAFWRESRKTGLVLLKWMVFAFLLESLLIAYLPKDLVAASVGGSHWWAIPLSVVIGTPVYLNGYAAIPTVARLVEMGMTPGAALAFMTAGAITSIPAMAGVLALVRPQLFAWYLGLGMAGSLVVGYAYQFWVG